MGCLQGEEFRGLRSAAACLIRTWIQKYVPDVKVDHVANPNLSAADVKERLGTVKGHLIEMPLQFLIDQRDAYEGIKWYVSAK
jgi:phospholipase D1/2